MYILADVPLILFVVSLIALWFSVQVGDFLRKTARPFKEDCARPV